MKKIVKVPTRTEIVKEVVVEERQEVKDEIGGLMLLLGEKNVVLMCANYLYTGTLTGVNDTCVELEDPSIVYETGAWSSKEWKYAEKLPCKKLTVQTAAIEAAFIKTNA